MYLVLATQIQNNIETCSGDKIFFSRSSGYLIREITHNIVQHSALSNRLNSGTPTFHKWTPNCIEVKRITNTVTPIIKNCVIISITITMVTWSRFGFVSVGIYYLPIVKICVYFCFSYCPQCNVPLTS